MTQEEMMVNHMLGLLAAEQPDLVPMAHETKSKVLELIDELFAAPISEAEQAAVVIGVTIAIVSIQGKIESL